MQSMLPVAIIRVMLSLMVLLSPILLNPAFSQAQVNLTEEDLTSDPCEGSEDEEHIPVGGVASTGMYGPNASVDVDLGESVSGGTKATIKSSINRLRSNRCQAVFQNVSECNAYSISVSVMENELGGSSKRINSGSFSIDPGKTKELPFNCRDKKNYKVEISSYKILKRK